MMEPTLYSVFAGVCKKIADEKVHEILEYLDSGAGADEICKLIHLCKT